MKVTTLWGASPLARGALWVLFAIVFYNSGLAFTIWLLGPEEISSPEDWLWVLLFPALLPAFFLVNRRLGCASGTCGTGSGKGKSQDQESQPRGSDRMPGI